MVKVHQDTVDTYLEDIILLSVDKTADIQARMEVQEQAQKINDIAYELEDTYVTIGHLCVYRDQPLDFVGGGGRTDHWTLWGRWRNRPLDFVVGGGGTDH